MTRHSNLNQRLNHVGIHFIVFLGTLCGIICSTQTYRAAFNPKIGVINQAKANVEQANVQKIGDNKRNRQI